MKMLVDRLGAMAGIAGKNHEIFLKIGLILWQRYVIMCFCIKGYYVRKSTMEQEV